MRAHLVPLLLVAATSVVARPTWAADPSPATTQNAEVTVTHVLGFAANDHFEQASALTKAIRQVISTSTNARLGEGEFSLEVLTAALGCNDVPDAACLKKISAKTGAKRFIWGTLTLEGQRVKAEIFLYNDGRADAKTQFSYQSTMTDSMDADLQGIAAKAVSEILPPLTFPVLVRAQDKEGRLLVDGTPAGTLSDGQATIATTSGEHVISLEAAGAKHAETNVRVRVDGTTKVRLDAAEIPATTPTTNSEKPTKVETDLSVPPAPSTTDSNAQRTWGYITLGAGGVLLAAGGLSSARLYMLSQDSDFKAYRDGLSSNQDACTEADRGHVVPGAMTPGGVRSVCSEGKALEVAQIVFFATGAVAAGAGLTLLLTSKPKEKTASSHFEPRVTFGKDRTDVGLLMHF
ncbi:MAG: hypothetical protein QM784_03765 [Polyangiaceae bacterium]